MQTDAKSTKQPTRKPKRATKGKGRKAATKPQPESGKKSTSPNTRARAKRGLSVRQERFCEFIAAGETGVNAWVKAGYGTNRIVGKANAHRMLTNACVAARIAQLRKPEIAELAMTKQYKREMLQRITASDGTSTMAKIRAIEVDAKLAGHFEPDRVEVETGPITLESIRQRAVAVATALAR